MTRLTRTIDRIATFAVALVLIAAGVLAVVWALDRWLDLPRRTDTADITTVLTSSWWPWACGFGGLFLILIGLRWVFAHLPSGNVGQLNLPGTGDGGRLRFNAKSAASTAAAVMAELPSVRSARGKVRRDRGQLVVALDATVDPEADLLEVAAGADRVVADLAAVMGRRDLYGRVRIKVSTSRHSKLSRVE